MCFGSQPSAPIKTNLLLFAQMIRSVEVKALLLCVFVTFRWIGFWLVIIYFVKKMFSFRDSGPLGFRVLFAAADDGLQQQRGSPSQTLLQTLFFQVYVNPKPSSLRP